MSCAEIRHLIHDRPVGLLNERDGDVLDDHVSGCADCKAADMALGGFYQSWAEETRSEIRAEPLPASLRDAVAKQGPKARPAIKASRPRALSTTCVYCHDDSTPEEAVYCTACIAPHHEDCFAVHGECATPGCQNTSYVRAKTVGRSRWSKRLLVPLTSLLVCTVVGGVGLAFLQDDGELTSSDGNGRDRDYVRQGADALVDQRYREARDAFRRAKVHVPTPEQRKARTLEKVASLYMTAEDPVAFRWEKAGVLLDEPVLGDVRHEGFQDWLKREQKTVRSTLEVSRAYDAAFALMSGASSAKEQGASPQETIDAYRKALAAFDALFIHDMQGVPRSNRELFLRMGRMRQRQAKGQIVHVTLQAARERTRGQNPDWEALEVLLRSALDCAQEGQEAEDLQGLLADCELNKMAEALYLEAVEIVKARDVPRYDHAISRLSMVDKKARIYPDAQAYIEWIGADRKARDAKQAYDLGDARRAFTLLNEAMSGEVLGPEARASLVARRAAWARVVRAYERGMQSVNEGKLEDAREEFERVLSLEENANNRYHARSASQLEYIRKHTVERVRTSLDAGLKSLAAKRWAEATRSFNEVLNNPSHTPDDLTKIREAVAKADRKQKLFKKAEDDFRRDRVERFVEVRYVLLLLAKWLPKDHPNRAKVRKLLASLVRRMTDWKKDGDW